MANTNESAENKTVTISEMISQIENNNLGSIYTKADVIKILETCKQPIVQKDLPDFAVLLENLVLKMKGKIFRIGSEFICDPRNDIEFSLCGNEIIIENINIDFDPIIDLIESEMDEFLIENNIKHEASN